MEEQKAPMESPGAARQTLLIEWPWLVELVEEIRDINPDARTGTDRAVLVLWDALAERTEEINRLMGVYKAAAALCDDPFGSLDARKFYELREAFYA